eukprot:78539_1
MALSFLGMNPLFVVKALPKPTQIESKLSNSKLSNNSETSDDEDSDSGSDHAKQPSVYHILTHQRNEAILRAQKLENHLKEYDVEVALKCDQINHELKQYKNANRRLQNENTEIRDQIQHLKDKLQMFDKYGNLNNLIRKRKPKSQRKPQLPSFVQKERNKRATFPPHDAYPQSLSTIIEHKQIPHILNRNSHHTDNTDDTKWFRDYIAS